MQHYIRMKGENQTMEAITYSEVNGYQIPNIIMDDDGLGEDVHIGIWGRRRLNYLKNYRRVLYTNLLMSCKLRAHLHEIDVTAHERSERMIEQMMKTEGVTEQLKAENQMEWVGRANNIRNRVSEIINDELIFS